MATEAAALAVQRERAARAVQEEKAWQDAAAAFDEGRGIALRGVTLNNLALMENIYAALSIADFAAKTRLNAYIQRLQQQQQQQQQNGKLRCCFCILVFKCCFEYGNTVPYSCIRWNGACCCSALC
jgi:hypothetical protein